MTKNEYIGRLKSCLTALPPNEREEAVSYYEEFFEDAGEENTASVIAELGSPEKLAKNILSGQDSDEAVWSEKSAEEPPAEIKTESTSENKKTSGVVKDNNVTIIAIVILALTCPVWGGAAIGLVCAVFGLLLGVAAATGAMILGGVTMAVYGFVNLFGSGDIINLGMVGGGLILLAIGLFLLVPAKWLYTKGVPAMFRGMGTLWRRLFGSKGAE